MVYSVHKNVFIFHKKASSCLTPIRFLSYHIIYRENKITSLVSPLAR